MFQAASAAIASFAAVLAHQTIVSAGKTGGQVRLVRPVRLVRHSFAAPQVFAHGDYSFAQSGSSGNFNSLAAASLRKSAIF